MSLKQINKRRVKLAGIYIYGAYVTLIGGIKYLRVFKLRLIFDEFLSGQRLSRETKGTAWIFGLKVLI